MACLHASHDADAATVAAAGATIGVDIGGTKVLAVRLGAGGAIEEALRRPTPTRAAHVVELVLELSALIGGADEGASTPLGVGCPGMMDTEGTAHFCPHLHDLDGFPLRAELSRRRSAGATTVVLNDATAACWAEHALGAAVGIDDVLMTTFGTGIGGGAVTGGRLLLGAHGFAGEFGHMVVHPGGPLCPCGKRGCWERYASGEGLGRMAREAAVAGRLHGVMDLAGEEPDSVRGEHVSAAALAGDPEALALVEEMARWLALGLANLANAFDPSVIVLGGGMMAAGETVLGPVRSAFDDAVEAPRARGVRIVAAHFGERAGAVGAALWARREAGRRP